MPPAKPDQDTLNQILIHVGETRKGIAGLESDVKKIEHHLSELNHSAVRKAECTQRHVVVAQSIGGLKDELKADIKGVKDEVRQDLQEIKQDVRHVKSRTGQDHPAITSGMLLGTATGETELPEEPKEGKGPKYWLGVAGGIIGILLFLGGSALGLMKLGRKWEQMEQTVEAARKQQAAAAQRQETQAKQLQQAVKKLQQPIILPSPPAPEPTPKRPRRRRRAPRRVTP
jgi:DNA repair exonuclease SbcCD ATPase subunit